MSGQAEHEKLTTDLPSQPTLEINPNENLSQQGPSRIKRPANNVVKKTQKWTRQKWTREDYMEVMFCYYKAKPDPKDNALMNQRRYIER